MKKRMYLIVCLLFLTVLVIFLANRQIEQATDGLVYNTTQLPANKAGLLLGTSQYLKSGRPNRYFANRMVAAAELYKAGKIGVIVASGDNKSVKDNEPLDMKNALIRLGVPEEKIYLDYAGFRTFDSVVRMKEIFGQTDFTVISQEFHNCRAVFIANRLGMHAIGYNAQDVGAYNGFKTNLREKFSRVKVFIDLWTGKQPKFLGEKIVVK
jgi:SanA protein